MPFWTEKSNCEEEMKTPLTYLRRQATDAGAYPSPYSSP